MVKEEIISLVKNHVGVIDATQKFHNRFLEAAIERVLIEMYSDLYKINPLLLDLYTKRYGVSTPISILYETATHIHYSTIPCKIVNLPCKSSGVRHIYTLVQGGNIFVPMDSREADLIFNTDIAVVTSKVGYEVRQDTRVNYYGASSLYGLGTTVVMDLLIPFSEYTDTEVVMIPELNEKQGGAFLSRALRFLQVVPPTDLTDDNNDETSQTTQNSRE